MSLNLFFIFGVLIFFLLTVEISLSLLLSKLRKRYDIILTEKDKNPELNKDKLKKYLSTSYDSELGWVRSPNTSKTEDSFSGEKTWNVNSKGSRVNPKHEHLKTKIITFGDSFTFNREVNDDETWQYYLADLIRGDVANFGVGNYGLDQSFLRFKREIPNYNSAKLTLIGVVPDTIVRNLTVWKHYSEFGNTFGFKPRFVLENGKLKLIPNPAKNKEDFYNLKKILPIVNKYDYFYESFKENLFTFPYTISVLRNPRKKLFLLLAYGARYFFELFKINWRRFKSVPVENTKKITHDFIIKNRLMGYKNKKIRNLTIEILKEFSRISKEKKIPVVFLLMPQKEDLDYILETKDVYYEGFIRGVEKFMPCVNITKKIMQLKDPLSIFPQRRFSESYVAYGGHYSPEGNRIVAEEIKRFINSEKIKIK